MKAIELQFFQWSGCQWAAGVAGWDCRLMIGWTEVGYGFAGWISRATGALDCIVERGLRVRCTLRQNLIVANLIASLVVVNLVVANVVVSWLAWINSGRWFAIAVLKVGFTFVLNWSAFLQEQNVFAAIGLTSNWFLLPFPPVTVVWVPKFIVSVETHDASVVSHDVSVASHDVIARVRFRLWSHGIDFAVIGNAPIWRLVISGWLQVVVLWLRGGFIFPGDGWTFLQVRCTFVRVEFIWIKVKSLCYQDQFPFVRGESQVESFDVEAVWNGSLLNSINFLMSQFHFVWQ